MARARFRFVDFLWRWVFAQALVLATFNPTEFSYVRWARDSFDTSTPLVLLVGLLLFVGYVVFVRATLRSMGPFGISLVIALAGALLWLLVDNGLLSVDDVDTMTWIGLICLGLILGLGMSWSHVRRMLSGQYDTDDVDE